MLILEERRRQKNDAEYFNLPRSRKVDGVEYTVGADNRAQIRLTCKKDEHVITLFPPVLEGVKMYVEA